MFEDSAPPASSAPPSFLQLLIGTSKGRVILAAGVVYTLIVSLSLGILYFAVGFELATIGIAGYIVFTAGFVYFRIPSRDFLGFALLVFSGIPAVGAVCFIGAGIFIL